MAASVVALDSRRPLTIGGSEAGAACGLDPYRSRVMLWAEKTGRIERETSEAARWGNLLQPVIAAELEHRGFAVMPAPADGFRDDSKPWLTGHPDGFTEVEGAPGILEIKTAGPWAAKGWDGMAGAPLAYLAQLQHYFELTGYAVGLLAVLIAGQRLVTRVVQRDDVAIAHILEMEASLVEHIRSDQPPAPDGSDSARDALAGLYPRSAPGSVVRLTSDGFREYQTLKARREQRDAIAAQVEALEQRLKLTMGDAETAISPHDEVCARWTSYDRTAVDVKLLKETRPELAELFTTTTPLRRFTVE
jgi:putative phage-type endonuclease